VLATNRAELYAQLSRFNQAIASRAEDVNAQARALYDLLLKDAQPYLEGRTQLIVAPDAVSWGLPLQALRNEAERFLIEDFAFSYTPSLAIFNAVANTRLASTAQPRRAVERPAALLAVANPALGPSATELLQAALQSEPLAPLTEAEIELAALAELYGVKDRLLLGGAEAAEDRIKSEIGKHRFVHLATRGIHHEASPLFSLLAFAPNAEAGEANGDGLLDLREVMRLDLKAELVVLSGSDWAKPQTVTNRAMTAWTWSWFVAGAPATLLSQWRAESPSTTGLMAAFHRQLKTPTVKSKAVVWQAAVKQSLSQEEFRQPYFWAGFTMLGNGR
jgi:CHAT domain-containing protein